MTDSPISTATPPPADPPGPGRTATWLALLLALASPTLLTLVYFVWMSSSATQTQQGAFAVGKILQFGFPLLWLWLGERGRVVLRRPNVRECVAGGLLGLVIVLAMLGFYAGWLEPSGLFDPAKGAILAKLRSLGIATPLRFLGAALFYCVCHAFLEEYYFRWFLFGRLEPLVGTPRASLISALGFMAHHVIVLGTYCGYRSPLTWFLSFCVAVGGVLWALLYRRTGALYAPWISHLLVDAGIFGIGYHLLITSS